MLIDRRLWLLIDRWLWHRCRRRRRLRLRGRQRIKKPYAACLFVARPAHRGTIRHGVLLRHRAREALGLSSGCSHERSIHELTIDYHLLRASILNRLNLAKTFGSRSSESHNETHCKHNCPAPHNYLLDVFVHELFRSQQRLTCSLKNVTAVFSHSTSIASEKRMDHRLLVIKNGSCSIRDVTDTLGYRGYSVATASEFEIAVDPAFAENFDLIVIDHCEPHVSAIDICTELRGRSIEVPVLVLVARDHFGSRIAIFKAGADDYFPKPFENDALLQRVRELVSDDAQAAELLRKELEQARQSRYDIRRR